ncbi:MAG: hypothetical protein IKG59_01310, partial [Firmicutes bacterium]|nr:hypothetical protein [Bacillota bacterium]
IEEHKNHDCIENHHDCRKMRQILIEPGVEGEQEQNLREKEQYDNDRPAEDEMQQAFFDRLREAQHFILRSLVSFFICFHLFFQTGLFIPEGILTAFRGLL